MELHNEAIELYEKIKEFKQQIDEKSIVNKKELKDIQCLYFLMRETINTLEKAEDIYFKNEKL